MAYSDYGAFVWKNGERVKELEDGVTSLDDVGFAHGIIRDELVEVICYKQGLPKVFYKGERIPIEDGRDYWDYGVFFVEYNGYVFKFISGYCLDEPYEVRVTCPNKDEWVCKYDYEYGAGWTDEDD